MAIELKLRNVSMVENLQILEISKFLNFRENWWFYLKISANLFVCSIII